MLEKIENDTKDDRSKLESLKMKTIDLKSKYVKLKPSLANLEKEEKDLEEQLKTIQDKLVTVRKQKDETIAAKAKVIKTQEETLAAAKIIAAPLVEQLQKEISPRKSGLVICRPQSFDQEAQQNETCLPALNIFAWANYTRIPWGLALITLNLTPFFFYHIQDSIVFLPSITLCPLTH